MDDTCNEHLARSLDLARELLQLADQIDAVRADAGCGVVAGALRDCAYKIQALAQSEMEVHRQRKPARS